jgi:magnesium transporter
MPKEKDIESHVNLIELYLEDPQHSNCSSNEIAKALKNIHASNESLFNEYLQKIPNENLGDIALELPEKQLKDVIEELPKQDLVEVIEELDSDDATDLIQDIEDIDEQKAHQILSSMDEENQEEIKKLKRYDEDEAGSYMQTELFSAKLDEKISDSLDRLRVLKKENELDDTHNVFVVGSFGNLMFTIPFEDLIIADFNKTYREFLEAKEDDYKSQYVKDTDDIDEVAKYFKEHDLTVVPVVNYHGELVGRITSDDIYDVLQESATEQIYNLAGVDDEAEEEDFFSAGKKRGWWLFINLLTAIFASIVIGFFDETIKAYVALAVLMPIVASMGGNAGTQALTVTVRKLALGDIEMENAKETIKREILMSLFNGVLFAIILGVISSLWFNKPMLGVVIGLSMILNLLAAGFFGAVIPLLLKRLNIDPAVGSTVILTTVTDVVGFFSFLGLAKLILID